jgi:DNA-directed RNA polymerase subunit beta
LYIAVIRRFLNEISINKAFSDTVNRMSDQEIVKLAKEYENCFHFASPIFDGALPDEIKQFLKDAGYDESGQVDLYDGRTGEKLDRPVTVGLKWTLLLDHIAEDKIAQRSIGRYSCLTRQPLRGREKQGGQRIGEMEGWALQGYGAAFNLAEMSTIKSDDVEGRSNAYESQVYGKHVEASFGLPDAFRVLTKELLAMSLNLSVDMDYKKSHTQKDSDSDNDESCK